MVEKTEFAPAERAPIEEIKRQNKMLSGLPFVQEFLDAMPTMCIILNRERQIVFANAIFRKFAGIKDVDETADQLFLGKRPGEAAGCVRADITDGGCGTTVFCRTCGAVQSILNSQINNTEDVQECRMVRGETEDQLDLRVWSRPFDVADENFTVFSVMDISDEKRRKALERIFFHDVLNTAGGLKGLSELLMEADLSREEFKDITGMLSETTEQLLEEIIAQSQLLAAENGELVVSEKKVQSLEILSRIIRQFHSLSTLQDKQLVVNESAEGFDFISDPVLIRRVLINLTKNALEAEDPGATVVLNCFTEGDEVCFTVYNKTVMPEDVLRQLFTRSFSTKGNSRGLGTYSVKLITEKFLNGRVSFVSNEKQGTIFAVCYPKK
ncbi:HAMP domain-containing sensor histidine kinase [Pontiellaceae bacterium B1224]|nr:HAMP domain-containing sensor histidine kinase [Pontiellaceae bacterium B1224]